MFQTKVVKKMKTHFMFNNVFFENRAVYELILKNNVDSGRPHTIWRTRFACWISKATDTHPDYVILIAFPQQQLLHERVPLLCYKYITFCLVCIVAVLKVTYPLSVNGN